MITEAVGLQNRVLQYFHVIQLMNAFWKKKTETKLPNS